MAKTFGPQIKKLQRAINEKYDARILINKSQYYSKDLDRPLEILAIKQAVWNPEKQRYKNIELFSSQSDVQIVLWLRDYWYELNGWEVPNDNEYWNNAKEAYARKKAAQEERKDNAET